MVEYRRIILYIALAAVAFFLWQNWQAQHSHKPAPLSNQQQQQISSTALPPSTALAKQTAAKATALAPKENAVVTAGQLIHVHTDVLNATIDTHGGNVVAVSLPNYPVSLKQPNSPIKILTSDPSKLYIAQSGLTGRGGPDTVKGQAIYQTDQKDYQLAPGQKELVVKLHWRNAQGLQVTKTYHFQRDHYVIGLGYHVKNNSSSNWQGNFYAQIRRKKPESEGGLFHLHTYRGAAISTPEKPYEKVSYKDMQEENLSRSAQGGWLAMQQRYFLSAWVPNADQVNHYYSRADGDDTYTLGVVGPTLSVAKGQQATAEARLYVGPEIAKRLDLVAPHLSLTVDYGWLWFISKAIFWVMSQIHKIIGNWGWSIILVTLLIKLIFYKFSESSYRSMAKMRTLAPKMKQLKERYGDDKQAMSKATMELYRKEKVNPIGGCLPMLIQIPFFIALYYVLVESVELRQAPFIFWIHDLAIKDPYYILPVLMGLSMFAQQRLTPAVSTDPMQARMMMLMPVIFTVFFATFPAGLVLYWLTNNVASFAQQWFIIKRMEKIEQNKKKKR